MPQSQPVLPADCAGDELDRLGPISRSVSSEESPNGVGVGRCNLRFLFEVKEVNDRNGIGS